MYRRQARLRGEYIYRKFVEKKQRVEDEKRQLVKAAIEENRQIPTHLKNDAIKLQEAAEWGPQISAVDDEYRWAGSVDPKVVITTSRDPSSRLKMFTKEMRLMFPNAQRMNRGHYDIKHLIEACRANDVGLVTDVIVFQETRGNPDAMIVCHLPLGPTAYFNMSNVVMRHDTPDPDPVPEEYPHLVFLNLTTNLGRRVTNILKYLYPVPKPESRRVITFSNEEDFISFRHHSYSKGEKGEIELKEVGPRFELMPYRIILGTLEHPEAAQVEWEFKPFLNTASKRQFLALPEEDE
uniref:Brix domain-containing protein n=1 Tax=Syphacia muris TaxID=451379 RepID=A0A0N5A9G8_9BILA